MNSAQRRTTYRRLRKLMREKTQVVVRSRHYGRFRGVVIVAFKRYGTAGVAPIGAMGREGFAVDNAARYIKPLPRCQQVTL